ncbi:DHA2 family efflux MFS transporter permease subunit [Sphingomonas sp. BN140010]|uniref:DHA2 family efflux MFS transporter permease subunit n=1 Tax=Sphingomonas arvum TaxID=2992113 RepID=A0ABT3JCK5_9SPHN|nr:DHA2 family efflux MFS transporter permease subunit [Sphingomonas sp. BN140010]MCW3796495.1 DHA2 family efflux MFS transporter permease subunit [Sphingomonas sp. BN140010]
MPAAVLPVPTSVAERRASTRDWLAVAAGAIGSFMATLDISIVNSALPTIQGEIGASASEGTWIATSYLVAEIVVIPLTGWLERVFGLRRFLLIAAVLFTGFSVLCGFAGDLTTMIIGRTGQGFTGGAMIPTAMTIIATRLPPSQQPIGTALFGSTVILGPVFGPLIGGWLTEAMSWHYAFFLNVPICLGLMIFLLIGLPSDRPNWSALREADWLGIAGMAIGLGSFTVVLEEGHREQWFDSALITQLSALAIVGFVLIGIGQLTAKRPVIRLALMRQRQFASVIVMALATGVVLYGASYVIPQFLAGIAGYNAMQAGQVVFLSGLPAMLAMPLLPIAMKYLDVRVAVAGGFLLMAFATWINNGLTAASAGSEFTISQLILGFGQVLAMIFLNQAAISAVDPADAGDASGLFNAARNLGGSVGLAVLATLRDERTEFHRWNLHSGVQWNDIQVQDYFSGLVSQFGSLDAAYQALDGTITREAVVMAFNDSFTFITWVIVTAVSLTLFLKPLPKGGAMVMH